jgi:hypothetical protein
VAGSPVKLVPTGTKTGTANNLKVPTEDAVQAEINRRLGLKNPQGRP